MHNEVPSFQPVGPASAAEVQASPGGPSNSAELRGQIAAALRARVNGSAEEKAAAERLLCGRFLCATPGLFDQAQATIAKLANQSFVEFLAERAGMTGEAREFVEGEFREHIVEWAEAIVDGEVEYVTSYLVRCYVNHLHSLSARERRRIAIIKGSAGDVVPTVGEVQAEMADWVDSRRVLSRPEVLICRTRDRLFWELCVPRMAESPLTRPRARSFLLSLSPDLLAGRMAGHDQIPETVWDQAIRAYCAHEGAAGRAAREGSTRTILQQYLAPVAGHYQFALAFGLFPTELRSSELERRRLLALQDLAARRFLQRGFALIPGGPLQGAVATSLEPLLVSGSPAVPDDAATLSHANTMAATFSAWVAESEAPVGPGSELDAASLERLADGLARINQLLGGPTGDAAPATGQTDVV